MSGSGSGAISGVMAAAVGVERRDRKKLGVIRVRAVVMSREELEKVPLARTGK